MSDQVGPANYLADQLTSREDSSIFLPFDHLPRRDHSLSVKNHNQAPNTVDWYGGFDIGQLSLPIESQFKGFNFRECSRDPTSYGLMTPVDELTGLPLPIVITAAPHKNANTRFSDYHHHFHPERDLIHADDASLALRRSRGQYLPRWLHEHYHHYFAGPEIPNSRKETFAAVVLACAGVVPKRAIDFSGNGPKTVEIADQQTYQRVVDSIKHEGEKTSVSSSIFRAQIGIFFANYAIEQSFEEVVSQRVINEFLETSDVSRRKVLGNLMLRDAIHLSIEPIVPIHKLTRKEGTLPKRKTDLSELIKDFFVRSRRPQYYQAIENKLKVA